MYRCCWPPAGATPSCSGRCASRLQTRVPEHVAALRDALRDQNAPRLREAAHKFCGLLSEFSTVAGDRAGSLEDIAAGTSLHDAPSILQELEAMATKLVQLADELSLEALQSTHPRLDDIR